MADITSTKDDSAGCIINENEYVDLWTRVCALQDELALLGPLSNATPIPDQDGQATKRQGSAGISTEIARADHNHEIKRLPYPADPIPTIDGAGVTLNAVAILDRESTEEWVAFKVRVHLNRTAGIGWHRILVPQLAGYQQRMITGIGNYRSGSISPQDDSTNGNPNTGASPRGPYMGKEWHEWSSTGILYGGYYRRDNNIGNEYVEYWVKYICS